MTCTGAPTCGACGLPIHKNEIGLRHRGTRTLHSESRCIDLLLQKVNFLKLDAHILEQQRDNALADYKELREAARMALEALDIACLNYGEVGSIGTHWGDWDAAVTKLRKALGGTE